jgi:hypothetical protein
MRMSKKELLAISAKTGQQFSEDDLKGAKGESKHHNKFTVIDNITFASKIEADHYCDLRLLLRAGKISNLEVHKKYGLTVSGVGITNYVADFVFTENGRTVVQDTKGADKGLAYEMFLIKKRLVLACYGIEVEEVRR